MTIAALFYLTLTIGLAGGSYDAAKQDDDGHLVSSCAYKPYPNYDKIDVITCRNMGVDELKLYENVNKMELINIPLAVLNRTQIPSAVQSEKVGLRQLYWTKSQIKTVQSVTVVNLTELDLSGNIIRDVRENAFEYLVSLYKLNLSYNSIETLPDKLFGSFNPVSVLSLSQNRLKILPADIFQNLANLKILDLSNNELNYLHEDTFSANVKLEHLDLSHNQLNSLPAKIFHSLSTLKYLSLETNILIHLEAEIFSKLISLMTLDIGQNPLWTLPNELLPANNTLFILAISHTKLMKINPSVFQNLPNLRKLLLSQNRNLQNLHNDTFAKSKSLKIIDLQNNNFTQLPHSITNILPDELLLDGNPWPCDCSVQWIVNWMKSLGELKNNVRLSAYCNSTDRDLTETVYRMQCKPTIVLVSPISYQTLQVNLKLVCRAFANPRPLISWVTPKGLAYIKSESAIDLLRYHPTFDNYPHLDNLEQNYDLNESGEFHIKSMTRDDAGEYLCIATNKVGEAFARTRLFVDPSVMQRIKTDSLICGILWINGFLVFSVVYILVRKCVRRATEDNRKRRIHENMDVYKSQQIAKLRERCKNQMNRIKNNCSIQVEWMRENYIEFMKNTQDHRSSYLTTQYNQQMIEIREYYLKQIQKVREYYEQQRNQILEFSINQNVGEDLKCSPPKNGDILVKMENGNIPTTSIVTPEEDVYKYNDAMKNEIQKLTSLRNLHQVFLDGNKNGVPKTPKCEHENGILKTPNAEDDDHNENTNMLVDYKNTR